MVALALILKLVYIRRVGFAPKSHRERASLMAQMVKNLPTMLETWVRSLGQEDPLLQGIFLTQRPGFDLWVRKIPWRREWLPTPVFLPGESHGQRGLEGYSPQFHKESDTTEQLNFTSLFT